MNKHMGTKHMGTKHMGTKHMGTKHMGTKHMGTKHMGTKHMGTKHSLSKHRRTKRIGTKRMGTKRHTKSYTKLDKRLKRKTRRLIRLRSRKHIYRLRGGSGGSQTPAPAPIVTTVSPMTVSGQNTGNIHSDMTANQRAQNSGNIALKGGAGSYIKNRQKGGSTVLDLYAYAPPPGMMGPIPQPSHDAASNDLILQAAKISTTGQANAQFDKNC